VGKISSETNVPAAGGDAFSQGDSKKGVSKRQNTDKVAIMFPQQEKFQKGDRRTLG